MTLQGVRRWLLGETLPKQEKIEVLAAWLEVEPQALRYGETVGRQIREARGRWDATISAEERQVLERYLALPIAQRKVVAQVIEAFHRAENCPPLDADATGGRTER